MQSTSGIEDGGFGGWSSYSTSRKDPAGTNWNAISPLMQGNEARLMTRYDYLALQELEFPSYNVTWMKGIPEEQIVFSHNDCRIKGLYSKQRVLLSTHAPKGENNFIYRLEFQIPSPDIELDLGHFGEHGNSIS